MTDKLSQDKKYLVSFGRRKSRTISDNRNALLDNLLPKYKYSKEIAFAKNWHSTALEIGFGTGDHIYQQAANNPQTLYIGAEPYINGVCKLLELLEQKPLDNILIHTDDARYLMHELPKLSIDILYILFPDPWRKKRHYKRRLISAEGLDLFYEVLKEDALLRIATDHVDYSGWAIQEIMTHNKFNWKARSPKDWKVAPNDWVETKYQRKASKAGRYSVWLDFNKK